MADDYAVRNTLFESGERFALLVDRRTGIPLFDTTVFTLTEFRTRNRASNTIEQVLRALKVFVLFCDQRGVCMYERMGAGRLLEMGEIDALVQMCRLPLLEIEARADAKPAKAGRTVVALESYRARAGAPSPEIEGTSAAIRIRYIRQFIGWLADRRLLGLHAQHPSRAALVRAKDIVVAALAARVPADKGRNAAKARRALDERTQERLWEIIAPGSPENPWTGQHTQVRNELIVRWFMGLGVRRGELLVVKVSDVNLRANEVFIARRADDKNDPRAYQPNSKTADRLLPLSEDLARRTRQYIVEERRSQAAARKHPFLFVANGGRPLSLRGLNRIFNVLTLRCPDLPNIFPHVFRHTNNYNFSTIADESGMDHENEKKTRSRLMGWVATSKSAETYTQREIDRQARKASLKLQEKMVRPINDNDEQ